jgi:ComF family protein
VNVKLLPLQSGRDPKASFSYALLDFFIPQCCPVCGSVVQHLESCFCSACLREFTFIDHPLCPRCGEPFKSPEQQDHLCQTCLQGGWHFDRGLSIFYYRGALRTAIHLFKYSGRVILTAPLAGFLHERGVPWVEEIQPDIIIPVPSHKVKLKKRGFNPPLFLARHLAKKCGIVVLSEALISIKHIPSQAGLKRGERLKNVRGTFLADKKQVKGQAVLLIDDVLTTGATANECARSLKTAGASSVAVMTLARAVEWDLQMPGSLAQF